MSGYELDTDRCSDCDENTRGNHTMLDFTKCYIKPKNLNPTSLTINANLKYICNKNNLRVVGERTVVFDGSNSPTGFTTVLLLDESHISIHSYADIGLLAIDCFTCSKDPENHINAVYDIKDMIKTMFEKAELKAQHYVGRFLTD